jgi:tripartite ATP-independent transporter DctM subunit
MFSAMSGSTMATTALLGNSLVPEMEKRGYKKSISIGSVMASGGLAMMIPPSTLAVTWATIAEVSVGKMLMAGLLPGLLMGFNYLVYIIARCNLQPSIAPAYDVPATPLKEKFIDFSKYVLPLSLIVIAVTGLIFMGIATPSESAAMGALSCFVLAAAYRKLSWLLMKKAVTETLLITAMILLILSAAKAFGELLSYTGATREIVKVVLAMPLSPMMLIAGMMIVLLIMGMFMNALPMMMITLPMFMPVVKALGFDPVWFGLLFLITIEMGQTTPPFGLLLFVMKGVVSKDTTMGEIIRSGLPFLVCDAIAMIVVMIFPIIALWLPKMMGK